MALSSEAYDFSLFDTRYDNTAPAKEPKHEPEHEHRHHTTVIELPHEELEKNRKPKANPMRMLGLALVFTFFIVLGVAMVHSQNQLAVLTEQINAATQTLEESQSLEVQLNMRAAQTMSASDVEQYAEKQLGMSKVNSGQITYVNVAQQDKGTVLQDAEGGSVIDRLFARMKSWLAS